MCSGSSRSTNDRGLSQTMSLSRMRLEGSKVLFIPIPLTCDHPGLAWVSQPILTSESGGVSLKIIYRWTIFHAFATVVIIILHTSHRISLPTSYPIVFPIFHVKNIVLHVYMYMIYFPFRSVIVPPSKVSVHLAS